MATAHINIGSNLGDRRALIGQAVAAIEREFGVSATHSDWVESEPWGYDSDNRYLNIGINIEIDSTDPVSVLRRLRAIESHISDAPHRTASGTYADRPVDIDLIAIGSLIVDNPELHLPHPRMHLRPFVLRPMLQLMPNWIHPLLHSTPAELLAALSDGIA